MADGTRHVAGSLTLQATRQVQPATAQGVASDIYLYRIVSGSGYVDTKRMTLLK